MDFKINRPQLYRFPWTQNDNPGGWIEVTDICNLKCPGCFRQTLTGHRQIDELKNEVVDLYKRTNCSRISISGGEPLLYHNIIELVQFISRKKIKPIILTNGESLSPELIKELSLAGLYQFYFHVDSHQNRPGWKDRSESEMNVLRQKYIDMVNTYGKIKCGFLTTVSRSSLNSIPDVVEWFFKNSGSVIHMAFIAFRGIPIIDTYEYFVDHKPVDPSILPNGSDNPADIDISIEEMFHIIKNKFHFISPCAYLPGTTRKDSYKFLILNVIGCTEQIYGNIGAKTVALQQKLVHSLTSKYSDTVPKKGKEVFLMAFFDRHIRKALYAYLMKIIRKPSALFEKISVQSLVLQQPYEIIDGVPNLCDGCINMMIYKDRLINSCRLDEFRVLGGTISMKRKQKKTGSKALLI